MKYTVGFGLIILGALASLLVAHFGASHIICWAFVVFGLLSGLLIFALGKSVEQPKNMDYSFLEKVVLYKRLPGGKQIKYVLDGSDAVKYKKLMHALWFHTNGETRRKIDELNWQVSEINAPEPKPQEEQKAPEISVKDAQALRVKAIKEQADWKNPLVIDYMNSKIAECAANGGRYVRWPVYFERMFEENKKAIFEHFERRGFSASYMYITIPDEQN